VNRVCIRCGREEMKSDVFCPSCHLSEYTVESDNGIATTLYRLSLVHDLKTVPDGCLLVVKDTEV
jgi:hypothetical protein